MKMNKRLIWGLFTGSALTLATSSPGCTAPPHPTWADALGYRVGDVHSLQIGNFGFPYLPVRIGNTHRWLPFDTGNMIGLIVSSDQFDRLELETEGYYSQENSAGEIVARLRVGKATDVSFLGRDLGPTQVYELDNPSLPGLLGPTLLKGGHFTLDYTSRKIAVGAGGLPDSVPGFHSIPLIRSHRHPLLILVRGTIDNREILLELDTGKSRTVINPNLSSELALELVPQGVTIRSLRIGNLSFDVPAAKLVDQTGIDSSLPEPILAGIGSDILSRFVWTVDYERSVLWIPTSP